jgi:hypothetical protein
MKSLKRFSKRKKPLMEVIHELSPEGRASLRREVEALVRRINMKMVKGKRIDRLSWAVGLLYMLDGICQRIKL